MVKRAIASFRAQTYERKRLLIVASDLSDNGVTHATLMGNPGRPPRLAQTICHGVQHSFMPFDAIPSEVQLTVSANHYKTIGALRNFAGIGAQAMSCDLIAHFDSDDISHARRLEEQVALLEASGKMCVGFRELLFWDTRWADLGSPYADPTNKAWLYRNHQANWAAGASLMYARSLWERQPFDDAPHEDTRWMRTEMVSRECVSVSSLKDPLGDPLQTATKCGPRMICGIHTSNTEGYDRAVMLRNPDLWRRAPEWDKYAEEKMRCA